MDLLFCKKKFIFSVFIFFVIIQKYIQRSPSAKQNSRPPPPGSSQGRDRRLFSYSRDADSPDPAPDFGANAMAAAAAQIPPTSLAAIKADTTDGGSTLAMKASWPPSTKEPLTAKAAFITFPRSSIEDVPKSEETRKLDRKEIYTLKRQLEQIPVASSEEFFTGEVTEFLKGYENTELESLEVVQDTLSLIPGKNKKSLYNLSFRVRL